MVVISEIKKMFWGVTLNTGKKYDQTVQEPFHISMASLQPSQDKADSSFVSVMLESGSSKFLLCTLQHGRCLQQPLDLNFAHEEQISLFITGTGTIHLTGYLMPDDYEGGQLFSDDDQMPEDASVSEDGGGERKRKKRPSRETTMKRMKLAAAEESDEEDSDDSSFLVDKETMEGSDEDDSEGSDEDLDSDDGSDDDSDEEDGIAMMTKKKLEYIALKQAKPQIKDAVVKTKTKEDTPRPPSKETAKQQNATPIPVTNAGTPKSQKKESVKPQTPKGANSSQMSTPGSDVTGSKKKRKRSKNRRNSLSDDASGTQQTKTPATDGAKNKPSGTPGHVSDASKQKLNMTPSGGDGKHKSVSTPGTSDAKNKMNSMSAGSDKNKPAKKISLTGGVIAEDLKVGHGIEAKVGKTVHVYYTGRLQNGKLFDSVISGKPFKFKLGKHEVISGWDVGLSGMMAGGKRKLVIPPKMGYGSQSLPSIPPHSTLMFDVELLNVT